MTPPNLPEIAREACPMRSVAGGYPVRPGHNRPGTCRTCEDILSALQRVQAETVERAAGLLDNEAAEHTADSESCRQFCECYGWSSVKSLARQIRRAFASDTERRGGEEK